MNHIVTVQSGNLNVRSDPGTHYRIVDSLRSGTVVNVVEVRAGWCRLIRPAGWVSGRYLQPHGGGTTTNGRYRVTTRGGNLNVRSGPGSNYSVVSRLRNGAVVQVVSSSNEWRKLSSGGWVHAVYLIKAGSGKTPLPDWKLMWNNYSKKTSDEAKAEIGGKVDADWIENTCVVRLSRAMNKAGAPIPSNFPGMKVLKGKDGKNYAFRVREMRKYLEYRYGPPTISASGSSAHTAFHKRYGIIMFDVRGWDDATGHFDLWDRNRVRYREYFSRAHEVLLWAY